ncbi:MAG: hypothetical protein ABIQ74_09205 [Chitinophagales bacterium]
MKSIGLFFIISLLFLLGLYGWKCTSASRIEIEKSPGNRIISSVITPVSPESSLDAQNENEKLLSAGTISISTSHAVPLYKDIHSACTVDIFFSKRMQTRSILNDPYFSFIKSFNFTSLQYSGGSTADHDHAIIGDTRISGGKGDGYNISAEDCKARGENISTVLDGIGNVRFGVDFFNEYCALLNKLNIPGDLIANVQGGTLDELIWKIQQSHAHRVIFGMEQNLPSNARDFPDGKTYAQKIVKWIEVIKQKFPNIIIVLDAAPIYRANPKFSAWNDAIQKMPGDELRLYLWDKDAVYWRPDQNENLRSMNDVFSNTFPQWFGKVKQKFPDKKVSVWQWGLKPKTDIFNTMAACIYIGKFYKFMIDYNKANNNYIGYASFMSLKSLDRGDGYTLNHALALQACGKLFEGKKRVLDLTINALPGISGIACDDPMQSAGSYTMLLINETSARLAIPEIRIDNRVVQAKKFTQTSVSSGSLTSFDVSMKTQLNNSLALPPYSINIVEF